MSTDQERFWAKVERGDGDQGGTLREVVARVERGIL